MKIIPAPRISGFALGLLACAAPAYAAHIPAALDVPVIWTAPVGAGYLNFVEPGPVPLGISGTEEYTGWVDTPAAPGFSGANIDLVVPFGPPAFDNGATHGDRVDFDFVVENRTEEIAPVSGIPVLHPGIVGFLTWEIAPTVPTAHIDPAIGIPHAHAPGTCPDVASFVCVPDYAGPTFNQVDVFSIIADPVDAFGFLTDPFGIVADVGAPRDAALDYMLDFCNIITGVCAPGVPIMVFVPGWSAGDTADDYVARWVPAGPLPGGGATHVMIDPVGADPFHPDEIVQIDALVVSNVVPVPAAVWLFGSALGLLGWMRIRRRTA